RRQIMGGAITTGPKKQEQLMLMQMRIAKNAKAKTAEEAEMLKLVGNPRDGIITGIMIISDLKALEGPATAPAPKERKADVKSAPPADGKAGPPVERVGENPGQNGNAQEPLMQMAMADDQGVLEWGDRPENAPIVHFGGPLQVRLYIMQKLIRGHESQLTV